MLRNKHAVSSVADFTEARFMSVLDDPTNPNPNGVRKILLVSGKLYWELAAEQEKRGTTDTAVVRVEQLYPVPDKKLRAVLDKYPNAHDIRWVQEEPANQGAWPFYGLFVREKFPERLGTMTRVSRRPMSAPSAGSSKVHEVEQRELIEKAFND